MITWNDAEEREEELYLSAFWIGFDAGQKVERSVIELESMWRLEREVRAIKKEDARSHKMVRRPKQVGRRNRAMDATVRSDIQPNKGAREKISEERFREIVKGIIRALER